MQYQVRKPYFLFSCLVDMLLHQESKTNSFLFSLSAADKACTFVGTVAYVSFEFLDSSPVTFGMNAMWKY